MHRTLSALRPRSLTGETRPLFPGMAGAEPRSRPAPAYEHDGYGFDVGVFDGCLRYRVHTSSGYALSSGSFADDPDEPQRERGVVRAERAARLYIDAHLTVCL